MYKIPLFSTRVKNTFFRPFVSQKGNFKGKFSSSTRISPLAFPFYNCSLCPTFSSTCGAIRKQKKNIYIISIKGENEAKLIVKLLLRRRAKRWLRWNIGGVVSALCLACLFVFPSHVFPCSRKKSCRVEDIHNVSFVRFGCWMKEIPFIGHF